MTDIVERLLAYNDGPKSVENDMGEAADTITTLRAALATSNANCDRMSSLAIDNAKDMLALRADNARLREALEEYACNCEAGTCAEREGFRDWPCGGPARAALGEK